MDTSIRYGSELKSRSLRLHAKERFFLHPDTVLQAHAELDTESGRPSYLALLIRQYFPESIADAGVGIQYDRYKDTDMAYHFRARKAFLMKPDGQLRFNVKGRMITDKEFKKARARAAGEFCWYKFDFQKDQDIKLKLGYELCEKVPYFQISENNWTLNFDLGGRWNVRCHL